MKQNNCPCKDCERKVAERTTNFAKSIKRSERRG